MLETIHAYALECLGRRGEAEACRRRSAAYFTALAEAAESGLQGADLLLWLERLDADHDNLRAALAWSTATSGTLDVGLRLAAALWRYWSIRGFFREGRQWLAAALAPNPAATTARARALLGAGTLAGFQDDHTMARAYGAEALAIATSRSDMRCVAAALYLLATIADTPDDAFRLGEQSLALSRELGHQPGTALALHVMGLALFQQGQFELTSRLWEEGLAINRALGDKQGMGWFLALLGNLAVDQGEYEQAEMHLEASRNLFLQLGQTHGLARATRYLGHIALARGDDARAAMLARECEQWYRDVGDNEGILLAHALLGDVARRRRDLDQAKQLFRKMLTQGYELEYNVHVATALEALGLVAAAQDQAQDAAQLFGAAEHLREALQMPMAPVNRAEYERAVAGVRAHLGEGAFVIARLEGQSMALAKMVAENRADD